MFARAQVERLQDHRRLPRSYHGARHAGCVPCPLLGPPANETPYTPMGRHAPLLDPGGVLRTCRTATRTAACRRLQTIGFCRATAAAILLSTTLHIAGLNDAACLLAPSSFVRPLLGWHVEFAPDGLARH